MKPTILSPVFFLMFLMMLPTVAVSQVEEPEEPAAEAEESSEETAPEEPSEELSEPEKDSIEAHDTEASEEPADESGEEEMEAWLPPAQQPPEDYDSGATFDDDIEPVDNLPFAKGDMELWFGLGGGGGSGYFLLSVGAAFDYYVVPRLAPGIEIKYQTIFGDMEYPQSFTTLPYLKFVLIRSRSFAPYLIAVAGRDFQWAGTDDPEKGYTAVDSWIAGGGVGFQIGLSAHFGLDFRILFLYYFFDKTVYVVGTDQPVDGRLYIPFSIGPIVYF